MSNALVISLFFIAGYFAASKFVSKLVGNSGMTVQVRWWQFKYSTIRFWGRLRSSRLTRILMLSRIPANSNPFHFDGYHMGTDLVRGWTVMHEGYDHKEAPQPLTYLILINTRTGKRFRLDLPQD